MVFEGFFSNQLALPICSKYQLPVLPCYSLQNLEMCPEYLPRLEGFVAAVTAKLIEAPSPGGGSEEVKQAPPRPDGCMGACASEPSPRRSAP